MRKKMKRTVRKILSVAMAVVFLASAPAAEVAAAEANPAVQEVEVLEATAFDLEIDENTPSAMTTFVQCFINVTTDNGSMLIEISTGVIGTASVIGVKDIKIQKKTWYGWDVVAVSDGVEGKDTGGIGCTIRYANAVKGETYKISYTHYANVDRYEEFPTDSGSFVYNF